MTGKVCERINFTTMIAEERKSCLNKQLSQGAKSELINHLVDLHSSLHMRHAGTLYHGQKAGADHKVMFRSYLKRLFKNLNNCESSRISTVEMGDKIGVNKFKKYSGGFKSKSGGNLAGVVPPNDNNVPRKIFGREKFGTSPNCPDDMYPYEKPDGSCTDVQPDRFKREEGKHRRRERKTLKALQATAVSATPQPHEQQSKKSIFEKAKSLFITKAVTPPYAPAKPKPVTPPVAHNTSSSTPKTARAEPRASPGPTAKPALAPPVKYTDA